MNSLTDSTVVKLCSRVSKLVSLEISRLGEGLDALSAPVWLSSCVCEEMSPETSTFSE